MGDEAEKRGRRVGALAPSSFPGGKVFFMQNRKTQSFYM